MMKRTDLMLIACAICCISACNSPSEPSELERLASACVADDLNSCNQLALILQANGNSTEAANLLAKTCQAGLKIACSNLGEQYYDGSGVKKDLQISYGLF